MMNVCNSLKSAVVHNNLNFKKAQILTKKQISMQVIILKPQVVHTFCKTLIIK